MSTTLLTMSLAMALGQGPYGLGPSPYGAPMGGSMPEAPGGAFSPAGPIGNGYGQEQLYPYDGYEPWLHGHFRELPAYGGYSSFRPYNYRHVLSQSQVAGGWGMSPALPYSQEYFQKLRNQASLEQRLSRFEAALSRTQAARYSPPRDYPIVEGRSQFAGSAVIPPGATVISSRQGIDPAVYSPQPRNSRVGELQEQLRRQELQMQALQGALQDEYQRGAALPGTSPLAAPGP